MKHNLLEIIVMTICAVIAGCEVREDICDYCRVKEVWFRSPPGMKLEHGIPSHDTIQRVWSMLDPSTIRQGYAGCPFLTNCAAYRCSAIFRGTNAASFTQSFSGSSSPYG